MLDVALQRYIYVGTLCFAFSGIAIINANSAKRSLKDRNALQGD